MTAIYDFDAVLTSVLQADGPQIVPAVAVETALSSAQSVGQRRPLIQAFDTRAWPAPALSPANPIVARVVLIGVVLMVIIAGALALAGAVRFFEPPGTVFGVFERTGELPPIAGNTRYMDSAAVLHDGRVLVTGLYSTSEPGDAWAFLYDPSVGTWSGTGHEPEYRQLSTATTLLDGRVLIAGGWRVDTAGTPVLPSVGQLYDPETGRFEATRGSLATPRYNHTATLLTDGRVLITGGSGADFNAARTEMASAEIFDPETGMFSPTGPMSEPRGLHAATLLTDGRVLITGGSTSRETLSTTTAEVYDPATGTFSRVGSMREARSQHDAALLADGRVLVVGGSGIGADPTHWVPLASAELFDPATGLFNAAPSMTTERSGPGVLRLPDGRVLVAGGSNDYGAPLSAEIFDPAAGRFDQAGSSATPHGEGWMGRLPDGHVLILDRATEINVGLPELWSALEDPTPRSKQAGTSSGKGFTAMDTSSPILRSGHTATALADGRILLTGGTDAMIPGSAALASAELLDPKTGRFSPVGDMSIGRSGHVAVLLADGRVLVAGGEVMTCPTASRECSASTPRAEIFDPATGRFDRLPARIGSVQAGYRGGFPTAVRLGDGRVLYVGPDLWSTIIDPATGGDAPGPTINGGSGVVSLVGLSDGRTLIQCSGAQQGTYVVDAAGSNLTTLSTSEHWDSAIALADGRVLMVRETGDAALFDPASSTFTRTGSMTRRADPDPQGRYREPYERRLTRLDDGRVLVTGGVSADGTADHLADADVYDPATGTFLAIGPMAEPRFGQTATLLEDGRVVIIGGVRPSPDRTDPKPALIEMFDPSTAR